MKTTQTPITSTIDLLTEKRNNLIKFVRENLSEHPKILVEMDKMEILTKVEFYNYVKLFIIPFDGNIEFLIDALESQFECEMKDIKLTIIDKLTRYFELFIALVR